MRKTIDKWLEVLLITILLVMLLAVMWQVLSRYLLSAPSTMTDEVASYALIWLGLFGAAYATGKELHLAIDLLPVRLIQKAPVFFSAVIAVAVIFFAFTVMVIGGARLCWITYVLNQRSAALEVPLAFIYTAVPVSGLLIVYYSLDTFLKKRSILKKNAHGLYGSTDTGS